MKPIQYMKGNKDIPFEHQMMHIVQNYQGLLNKLIECRKERDEYKKKYEDVEPMVIQVRDIKQHILDLNKAKVKKESEISELNSCIEHKRNKLSEIKQNLKILGIEYAKKELELATLETKIANAKLEIINSDIDG